MFERLEQIASRYEELGQQMAEPDVMHDMQKYQKIAKQHRDLELVVHAFQKYRG
jgi:peptide chain release factor 1